MRILLAPETTPGHGSGHLRRMLGLLRDLPDSRILVPGPREHLSDLLSGVSPSRIVSDVSGAWDRVVVDRFKVDEATARALTEAGPTIGLDVGGPGRDVLDYLVDAFPRLDDAPVNVRDATLLDLPDPPPTGTARSGILVTFGGEDPAGLTEASARILAEAGLADATTVVRPSMRDLGPLPSGVTLLDPQPSLVPLIRAADVVVTAFGLTAYEARSAGARIATVAPTPYHDRLAALAGFARAGVRRPNRRRLLAAVTARRDRSRAGRDRRYAEPSTDGPRADSYAQLVTRLAVPPRRGCPAHPGAFGRAVWRNAEKSYFSCPVCGVRYLERFRRDEESYDEAYFMEEYEAQYGRTYLEDFDHIHRMGVRRVENALQAGAAPGGAVLDVGCAYGPFLKAAAERGMRPYGVDVAPSAVDYVRGELGYAAACGDIVSLDVEAELGRARFDLVTLWYVIEHFDRLDLLLEKLTRLVRPGGVLALSTPHGGGVSARRSPDLFYRTSPRDHFTIWDRSSARRLLGEHGFAVRRFVVTGHHPERYPAVSGGALSRFLAGTHSRIAGWGDTFEIYAVKEQR
ncbi:MAG: methyltransferase domain-containing protein [Spirochaetota bacterium]